MQEAYTSLDSFSKEQIWGSTLHTEDELFELGQEGDLIELPALGLTTTFGADGYPVLTKEILQHSLLSANYFPRLKGKKTELPPIFDSSDFTPAIAEKLLGRDRLHELRGRRGFGNVTYGQTRHEGSVRITHIPHPWAHANVVKTLIDGWKELEPLGLNQNSAIRPMVFRDGRVFVSNYSDGLYPELDWDNVSAFGATTRVNFDIKEFYGSIYTHAIVWAHFGRDYTQTNLKESVVKNHFTTKVEEALNDSNRKLSNGILIGPATSNLVAEYLLAGVDKKLREHFGARFRRHIDDYRFYAQSDEEIQLFQVILEEELSNLNLAINAHKTSQEPVEIPPQPFWLRVLNQIDVHTLVTPNSLELYWQKSKDLAKDKNAGMALRYGMRAVLRQAIRLNQEEWALRLLIQELVAHQYLAPLLDEFSNLAVSIEEREIGMIKGWLRKNFRVLYSDSRSWALFFLGIKDFIDDDLVELVLSSKDVVAMTVVYEFRKDKADLFRDVVIRDPEDPCRADEFWLLAYQLFVDGKISKDTDGVFEILRSNKVSFVKNLWAN